MMMDMEQVSKGGVALTGVAVILCGLSVAGVDRILLEPKVRASAVLAPYERAGIASQEAVREVNRWGLVPFDGQFVIDEKSPWEGAVVVNNSNEKEGEEGAPQDGVAGELEVIRLTGILAGRDGLEALVNKSRVKVGGAVLGYPLVELTEEEATFDVNGKLRGLHINEEMPVPKMASVPLNLDAVRERAGAWEAIINGKAYKAGAWVDPDTQIRVVVPDKVMIFRGGTLKTLSVE